MRQLAAAVRDPMKVICYLGFRFNRLLVREVSVRGETYHAYRGGLYPDYLHYGNACSFISERALQYCAGRGIDVGAGEWPLPGAIPIRDEAKENAYELGSFDDGSLDFVFSSHCLEHLDRWQEAVDLWIRKLKPGGVLFLYLPHESMMLWRRGGPWVGLGHKWVPTHDVLGPYLERHGMSLIDFNAGRDAYWSFHVVARRAL
jgi:SAM-dependent methyltransferase